MNSNLSKQTIVNAIRNVVLLSVLPMLLFSQKKEDLFLKKQQTMTERWELDADHHKGVFIITPYKPVFVTAGRYSDNPNVKPTSENPSYTLPFKVDYNNYEAKFQFSLKTKAIHGMFNNRADLWIGYTQQATLAGL